MRHKKQGPLKHQGHSQPLQEPRPVRTSKRRSISQDTQRECPECLGTGQDGPPPGQHHGLCPKCDGDGGKLEVKWKDAAKYGWSYVGIRDNSSSWPTRPRELKISKIIQGSCSMTTLRAEIEVIIDHEFYRLQVCQNAGTYTIDLIGNPNERIATGRLETYNILDFDDLYSRVSDWSAGYTAGYNNQRKH